MHIHRRYMHNAREKKWHVMCVHCTVRVNGIMYIPFALHVYASLSATLSALSALSLINVNSAT